MSVLEMIGLAVVLWAGWWAFWFSLYCYLNARSLAREIIKYEQISRLSLEWKVLMTALSFVWHGVPRMYCGVTKTHHRLIEWKARTIKQHWQGKGGQQHDKY